MKGKTGVNRKFTCTKCGQTKVSRMFPKNQSTKRGYAYECKVCLAARTRTYKQEHSAAPINRARLLTFVGYVVRGEGDCHGWTGDRNKADGRPMFQDRVYRKAARWICEYFWGPAPIDEDGKSYVAHHLCKNGDECVNPFHIRWISDAQHRKLHAEERRLQKEAV